MPTNMSRLPASSPQLHHLGAQAESRSFLSTEWRNLVMLNYPVDPSVLQPLVPQGTELDSWDGNYFLSVVGFLYFHTRVLGVPIPFHCNFEEVNLRFYVRRKTDNGWRRGVVFVKEVVPRIAVAAVARWLYNENFVTCPMSSHVRLPGKIERTPGLVEYRWTSPSYTNIVRAEFYGRPSDPAPGSEEEFITEHYWGYGSLRDGSSLEYRVEHPRWRVWRVSEATLDCDVQGFYGKQYQEALSQLPHSAFVAEGSAVVVRRGKRIRA
jgi:uncharacterized protein YqjF (DUF2071 family)